MNSCHACGEKIQKKEVWKMSDNLIIGIAGGSGSGKTTLTNRIAAQFSDYVTVIKHDNY